MVNTQMNKNCIYEKRKTLHLMRAQQQGDQHLFFNFAALFQVCVDCRIDSLGRQCAYAKPFYLESCITTNGKLFRNCCRFCSLKFHGNSVKLSNLGYTIPYKNCFHEFFCKVRAKVHTVEFTKFLYHGFFEKFL